MSEGSKKMGSIKFVRRIVERLDGFRRDRRGNVTVIIAAAIVPLVGALGLATDTSRAYLVRARLSQALDAAALAGGKVILEQTNREDAVKKYFRINFPTGKDIVFDTKMESKPGERNFMNVDITVSTPTVTSSGPVNKLNLSATADVDTTFMRVLGIYDVPVATATQVTQEIKALDVVLSIDFSGSMQSNSKIIYARDASINFVDDIFGTNTVSPTLTVSGTTYNLLNIGFVPWNSKVRVTVQGAVPATSSGTEPALEAPSGSPPSAITRSDQVTVTQFTNPVTKEAQTKLYYGKNSSGVRVSPVPLLMDPAALPGGWSGCIYARYLGDAYNDNDGDLNKGPITKGSGAGEAAWMGYEPMAVEDTEQDRVMNDASNGANWTSTEKNGWNLDAKQCNNAYINDTSSSNDYDNADGTRKNAGSSSPHASRPRPVPNPRKVTKTDASGNVIASTLDENGNRSSGAWKYWGDIENNSSNGTTGGDLLSTTSFAKPSIGSGTECTKCLTRGIIPLTNVKATIKNQLSTIVTSSADGNTNVEQGLFWGWEVLMPGVPFDQAVPTTPFARIQAIVLVTDGDQVGGNGDAYKGRFGSGDGAGTTTNSAHGYIKTTVDDSGPDQNNNLDNRLRRLAANIRGSGIKLYTIAFNLSPTSKAALLLEEIASAPDASGKYYYNVPDGAALSGVFKEIAASLSTVRLSM